MAGVRNASQQSASAAGPRRRKRGSGGILEVGHQTWRVDVEVGRDAVTGRRRRVSRTIRGTREMEYLDSVQAQVDPVDVQRTHIRDELQVVFSLIGAGADDDPIVDAIADHLEATTHASEDGGEHR